MQRNFYGNRLEPWPLGLLAGAVWQIRAISSHFRCGVLPSVSPTSIPCPGSPDLIPDAVWFLLKILSLLLGAIAVLFP